jgi:hypothetical protein
MPAACSLNSTGINSADGVLACGVLVRHESKDFLVLVADLQLGDVLTEPQRGDRVHETQNGTVYIHEVTAAGNEPRRRYSDV